MTENESTLTACRRCYATLRPDNIRAHNEWHAHLEQLEPPTSEFGFWDDKKRWNPNSRDW